MFRAALVFFRDSRTENQFFFRAGSAVSRMDHSLSEGAEILRKREFQIFNPMSFWLRGHLQVITFEELRQNQFRVSVKGLKSCRALPIYYVVDVNDLKDIPKWTLDEILLMH